MYSKVYGSDEGHSFGIYSEGIKRSTDTAGAAYGGYFIGNNYRSNGESYGVYAQATDTEPNSTNYGIYASAFTRDTESYGVYARAGGSSDSTVYGIYVDAYNYIGDGNSYGVYAKVTGYGGTHYGIYAEAENGTTNYAGYFVGTTYISDNVGIGTTSPDYELDVSGSARLTGDMAVEGRISIGTTNFGTYKLFVSGPAYSTGGWLGSDRRFKEYIETIDSPLDKIKSIKGVSFEWKTSEYKEKGFPEGRHFGVIAQEVEEVLPEIVKEGPDGDKAVSYTELVPILTEAIKQQQKQIENLQYEVKTLKEIMHQHKLTVAKEVQ